MIFDRTQADVDKAIELRANKVKKFIPLSEEEIAAMNRGAFTLDTMNRIEEKQEELKNLLNGLGYFNTDIITKTWTAQNRFDSSDLQRIFSNTQRLKEAFFEYPDTPKTPAAKYHFENINAVEKILNDLDLMISEVESYYRECGTFECGED